MSAPAPHPTQRQVEEDLVRLDAYRTQLNGLVQQRQLLAASRQDHARARESLEGIDRAEASTETVEESTTILGLVSPVSSPPGPLTTASRSWSAATMMNTMSRPASAAGLSTRHVWRQIAPGNMGHVRSFSRSQSVMT